MPLGHRYRTAGLLLILPTACAFAGCAEEVVESRVSVQRTNSEPCSARSDAGQPMPMNTYVIDILRVIGAGEGDAGPVSSCVTCLTSPQCAREHRLCLRGPDQTVGGDALQQALSGKRFSDLDGQDPYCVRLMAFQLTGTFVGTTLKDEPCKVEEWIAPPDRESGLQRLRACALSPTPVTLQGGPTLSLDLACLNDVSSVAPGQSSLEVCANQILVFPPR